jgi:hypothetical protein
MRDILGLGAGGSQPASGAEHLMDRLRAQATHLDTPQPLLSQTLSCLQSSNKTYNEWLTRLHDRRVLVYSLMLSCRERYGMVLYGMVWYGMVWCGTE